MDSKRVVGHKVKAEADVFFLPWGRRGELAGFLSSSGAAAAVEEGDWCAIKMHFGERGNDGYIRPEYVRTVVGTVRSRRAVPFLTDTCTIYHGPRKDALGHLEVAAEHGFTQEAVGAPVIIADGLRGTEHGEVEVPGRHFKSVKVASAILEADCMIVLSHFKGHLLTGFGGAVKNLGMGCGSRIGKFEMHSGTTPELDTKRCVLCGACVAACAHGAARLGERHASIDGELCAGCGECVAACPTGAISISWSRGAGEVQERMAEYAAGVAKGRSVFFVNFINHVTPNCDCLSRGEPSLVPDIGIVASADPVAVDQASYDLCLKAGGDVFARAHPGIDGTVQLTHGERMGLGGRKYRLLEA
jgi:uncharacterized Fe-S center protein